MPIRTGEDAETVVGKVRADWGMPSEPPPSSGTTRTIDVEGASGAHRPDGCDGCDLHRDGRPLVPSTDHAKQQRDLHVVAWHLRKLVPDSVRSSVPDGADVPGRPNGTTTTRA